MSEVDVTVRLPSRVVEGLDAIAASSGRTREELTTEALTVYLAVREDQTAGIEAALADLAQGVETIDHEDVRAHLEARLARIEPDH